MKWKIRQLIYYILRKLTSKKHHRKLGMWYYRLGEEDMIDDITSTNCL